MRIDASSLHLPAIAVSVRGVRISRAVFDAARLEAELIRRHWGPTDHYGYEATPAELAPLAAQVAEARERIRAAVTDYVVERKQAEGTPERVLAEVKSLVGDVARLVLPEASAGPLVSAVVQWCIAAYYRAD